MQPQSPVYDEAQVRAMILINLAKFIDWPPQRSDAHLPFIICAVGNEPVGANLQVLLNGKTVQGRPVIVRRGVELGQAESCHMLYVPHLRSSETRDYTSSLASASVLTMSPEHQAHSGMVIGLPLVDGHVQIEVDRSLAQRSALTLSSHLLRIAMGEK